MTDSLFRGGQPSEADLEALRAMGVTTIINLRAEALGQRRAEWARARELGMNYLEFPFFGVLGAQPEFLEDLLQTLESADGETIYVHDKEGRDRTSLVMALYRVCIQDWSPEEAWDREALDYGHRANVFSREIELTFKDHTSQRSRLATTRAHSRGTQAPSVELAADSRSTENGEVPTTSDDRLAATPTVAGHQGSNGTVDRASSGARLPASAP